MIRRRLLALAPPLALLVASCGQGASDAPTADGPGLAVGELRASYRVLPSGTDRPLSWSAGGALEAQAGPGRGGGRRLSRRARVTAPRSLGEPLRVADEGSGLEARVTLLHPGEGRAEVEEGYAVYRDGAGRPLSLVRAHEEGAEDYVLLAPGARAEVRYRLEPSGASGLRLVGGALELLDEGGAPRIRMEAPWAVDRAGRRRAGQVSVEGCSVDRDPAPPWGRPTTAPGARACELVVSFGAEGLEGRLLIDPPWSTTASMAEARARQTATALPSGKILVAGGVSPQGTLKTAEVYDPVTKTWAATGVLGEGRYAHTASALPDGRVLLAGGYDDKAGTRGTTEVYDPQTGLFSPGPGLVRARVGHTATALPDGIILLAGGCVQDVSDSPSCQEILDSAEALDAVKGQSVEVGPMKKPHVSHAASPLPGGGVLLVGGLIDLGQLSGVAEVFDPKAKTFTFAGELVDPRAGHTASPLPDGRVIVAGGVTGGAFTGYTELFSPTTMSWGDGPYLTVPRTAHRAVVMSDGAVGLFGGRTEGEDVKTAEILPAMGPLAWASGPGSDSMVGRTAPSAVLLGNGQVLVCGGLLDTVPQKSCEVYGEGPSGSSCSTGAKCLSGHCVDGVCCDSPCEGACSACSAEAKGQGEDGVCGPVAAGADPHDDCSEQSPSTCGRTGACDGAKGCALYAAGASCQPGACTGGVENGFACDGKGACVSAQKSCAPYACSSGGVGCASSCESDGDCDEKAYCEAGACKKKLPEASACAAGKQCQSGYCVDGVCCKTACTGQCEACDVEPNVGACSPVPAMTAPRKGRPVCKGEAGGACAGSCDGVDASQCHYPGALVTCSSSCAEGREIVGKCDGDGACSPQPKRDCAPYVCGASACRASCSADADCAPGYACSPDGTCNPKTGATCKDATTLRQASGEEKSCAPFRCAGEGVCLQACDSTLDCAPGFTCRADRTCKADSAAQDPGGDDGGCGCVAAGRQAPPLPLSALALSLFCLSATTRRRRP